jgi:site-specific recombinase XerD
MGSPRLMDRVRDTLRVHHYSLRTEQSYVQWIKRFILFHGKRHPRDMGKDEVAAFLTHLAVNKNVAAATQNQALSVILFLYKKVLNIELDWIEDVVRTKRPVRIPKVLTLEQVMAPLRQLKGMHQRSGRGVRSPLGPEQQDVMPGIVR